MSSQTKPTSQASLIKQLRQQRGWSQEQLAGISGVSVRTISRLERGDKGSVETLKALASAFEISFSKLNVGATAPSPGEAMQQTQTETAARTLEEEVAAIRHFHSHLLRYLLVLAGIAAVGLWDHSVWWSLPSVALIWGFFLLWHGLRAYQKLSPLTTRYERYLLERRLKKRK